MFNRTNKEGMEMTSGFIDCSTIADRCVVDMNEQMFCSLIWMGKYILLPLIILTIVLVLYIYIKKKLEEKQKIKGDEMK